MSGAAPAAKGGPAALAFVVAGLALILVAGGWGFCQLAGRQCGLVDAVLYGAAIFFVGLAFNLALCVAVRRG